MSQHAQFQYNDEFFFDDQERQRASGAFPSIWFALNSPDVADQFRLLDEDGKTLKAEFQIWGFRVVTLAVFALALAAIEPTFVYPATEAGYFPAIVPKVMASVAGAAGILSVLMGFFGMGFSGRKRRWLRIRMLCERIRQWRWQYICAHIPEIIAATSNDKLKDEYVAKRGVSFARFVSELRDQQDAALQDVLASDKENPDAFWCEISFKQAVQRAEVLRSVETSEIDQTGPAAQLLAAYANARIGAQRRYARYLVTDQGPFTTHPATQRRWLHTRGVALIMLIFVLHILAVCGIFAFRIPGVAFKLMSVLAVILALVALGLRAIEDGLRPAEHLGRIKGYLAETSSIEEAFWEARSAASTVGLMVAQERAAYKEMVDFMQAGNRSRYVM